MKLKEILSRKPIEEEEDLSKPPTKLPINLSAAGLEKGIDIFEGPPIYDSSGNSNCKDIFGDSSWMFDLKDSDDVFNFIKN